MPTDTIFNLVIGIIFPLSIYFYVKHRCKSAINKKIALAKENPAEFLQTCLAEEPTESKEKLLKKMQTIEKIEKIAFLKHLIKTKTEEINFSVFAKEISGNKRWYKVSASLNFETLKIKSLESEDNLNQPLQNSETNPAYYLIPITILVIAVLYFFGIISLSSLSFLIK